MKVATRNGEQKIGKKSKKGAKWKQTEKKVNTEVRKSSCGTEDMDQCTLSVFRSVTRKCVRARDRRAPAFSLIGAKPQTDVLRIMETILDTGRHSATISPPWSEPSFDLCTPVLLAWMLNLNSNFISPSHFVFINVTAKVWAAKISRKTKVIHTRLLQYSLLIVSLKTPKYRLRFSFFFKQFN